MGGDETQSVGLHGEQPGDKHGQGVYAPPTASPAPLSCIAISLKLNHLLFVVQAMLMNNITASFITSRLARTDWTVDKFSHFLSNQADNSHRPEGFFTWREVFNETDQAIMSISRFMEVNWSLMSVGLPRLVHSSTTDRLLK